MDLHICSYLWPLPFHHPSLLCLIELQPQKGFMATLDTDTNLILYNCNLSSCGSSAFWWSSNACITPVPITTNLGWDALISRLSALTKKPATHLHSGNELGTAKTVQGARLWVCMRLAPLNARAFIWKQVQVPADMNQYLIIARHIYMSRMEPPIQPLGNRFFAATLYQQHLITSGAGSSGDSYFYQQPQPLWKCITNIMSEPSKDAASPKVLRDGSSS